MGQNRFVSIMLDHRWCVYCDCFLGCIH